MTAVQAPDHFYTMVFEFRSRRKGRDPSHVYTAHSVFPPPEGAGVSFRLVNRRDSRRHTLLLGGPFERKHFKEAQIEGRSFFVFMETSLAAASASWIIRFSTLQRAFSRLSSNFRNSRVRRIGSPLGLGGERFSLCVADHTGKSYIRVGRPGFGAAAPGTGCLYVTR